MLQFRRPTRNYSVWPPRQNKMDTSKLLTKYMEVKPDFFENRTQKQPTDGIRLPGNHLHRPHNSPNMYSEISPIQWLTTKSKEWITVDVLVLMKTQIHHICFGKAR